MSRNLNPEKALIFRITHRSNVPWIARNGLHCANSDVLDPNFTPIGNSDLIRRRRERRLPQPYGGTLSDYVPFYFTPFSPMMLNIVTGYNGVPKQAKRDLVVLVSSLPRLHANSVHVVFSDRHAYLTAAQFYHELTDLSRIDWPLLQARDFKRDPNDPSKMERYEAEALARAHVPSSALIGAVCYDEEIATQLSRTVAESGISLDVRANKRWFF